jgi:hypothetical protein
MTARRRIILLVLLAASLSWLIPVALRPTAARIRPGHAATASAFNPSPNTPPAAVMPHADQPAQDPEPPSALSDTVDNRQAHSPSHTALETAPGPELAPGLTPVAVLQNLRTTFHNYAARLGGNPVGTNPEITASLNGSNPRHIVFLNADDGARINDAGELVDNWGTPYFFHQLSRREMEIHSAGPDRKLWTADDLVIR